MPTSRDLKNRGTTSVHIPAASIATDTTTNAAGGVDASDAKSVTFHIHSGAYTDGTYTPNIQESDDDSTYTDAEAVNIIGSETAVGAANTVVSIGVHPQKKYVRCQIVSASTSTGAIVGVLAQKQTS